MSKVEHIASKDAPAAIGPYVHATKFGNTVYVSGNIGITKEGKFVSDDVEGQTRQAMKNLKGIVETAGSEMNNVVKTTIFLADMADYPKVNKIYAEFFEKPNFPARSTVAVLELPKKAKVEIDAICVITEKKK